MFFLLVGGALRDIVEPIRQIAIEDIDYMRQKQLQFLHSIPTSNQHNHW